MYRPCLHCPSGKYNEELCPVLCTYGWDRKVLKDQETPLSVDFLRSLQNSISTSVNDQPWVWIQVPESEQGASDSAAPGYYRVTNSFCSEEYFNCGYPGVCYSLPYSEYGKSWIAYLVRQE